MSRTLYGLSISPWTERARWALEHHGIAYDYHEHVPMLGEVLLRMKARTMKASVPLFEDGDQIVMGSFEIAKHADRVGGGASLFPKGKEDEVARWADVAERMMDAGRACVMGRLLASKEAQAENLPSFIPNGVRGALAPSAGMAIRFLNRKYDIPDDADAVLEQKLRPLLRETRTALEAHRDDGGKMTYVLGPSTFSVVDLLLAATMQVIRPHEHAKIGPASREAWTNVALVEEFGDLLVWRDAIYAKHR